MLCDEEYELQKAMSNCFLDSNRAGDLSEISFDQLNLNNVDNDEYLELEKALQMNVASKEYIHNCVKRYYRMLEGIENWTGYESLKGDIINFIKQYRREEHLACFTLSKKIDENLYVIANN
jgi:hypothetical protein